MMLIVYVIIFVFINVNFVAIQNLIVPLSPLPLKVGSHVPQLLWERRP